MPVRRLLITLACLGLYAIPCSAEIIQVFDKVSGERVFGATIIVEDPDGKRIAKPEKTKRPDGQADVDTGNYMGKVVIAVKTDIDRSYPNTVPSDDGVIVIRHPRRRDVTRMFWLFDPCTCCYVLCCFEIPDNCCPSAIVVAETSPLRETLFHDVSLPTFRRTAHRTRYTVRFHPPRIAHVRPEIGPLKSPDVQLAGGR